MSLTYPALLIATIRQPQCLAADPLAFASWVKLVCRCSEDENGGVLLAADRWSEHVWLTYANVTTDGIDAAVEAGLCTWDGSTLVVNGYDHGAQKKVQTLRANAPFGKLGAEHGWKGPAARKAKAAKAKKSGDTANPDGGLIAEDDGNPARHKEETAPAQHLTPSSTPSGGNNEPPLTLPNPSDPIRTQPSPPPAGARAPVGSAWAPGPPKPPPRLWDADYWFKQFGRAWCERKGRVHYGMGGSGDSRARADLGDHLGELPESERLKAQAVADRMFALYLDDDDKKTVNAGHPFSWFVGRFNGCFARAAGGGKSPALRVVRPAIADLPAAVQRPADGPGALAGQRSGGGEAEGSNQGISSSGRS